MKRFFLLLLVAFFASTSLSAQSDRWQQAVKYDMDIDFDVSTHQFDGVQKLTYTNNSPDTLARVFYHLYFNAFQPGSMMDVRSRSINDPDPRVKERISTLTDTEIGFLKINSLQQDGKDISYEVVGTVLEVTLNDPILPNTTTVFDMEFTGQVPVQIRRSGRDNAEGISYSMCQWYPKMSEYDYQGWHANPYIGREFYGVWGDFDVNITIDKDYVIGGTGYLQNAREIGHGYTSGNSLVINNAVDGKLTWQFHAPQVHDFMWGADPDYKHTSLTRKDGMVMHFFYQENDKTKNWKDLPAIMDEAFEYINENFGQYPYKQYSFVQGGDGGMEYPMATFITGHRSLGSLVGVSVHELLHSWYQMILGTNESLHSWMDEGFTSYASSRVMNHLRAKGLISGKPSDNPFVRTYMGFAQFTKSGFEEALTTHADHFNTNRAYGVAAYTKGSIILNQLEYVVGKEAFDRALLRYFNTWKFKHPNPNDFFRIFEKESGLELDWYKEYFVHTTHTPDYAVIGMDEVDGKTNITLERVGMIPMPIDLVVTQDDGTQQLYNIPLRIMRGAKKENWNGLRQQTLEDWPWTNKTYTVSLDLDKELIKEVSIDPSNRMFELDRSNNSMK